MRNPFKPTAGATPPLLVGRDGELAEFEESLEDGPGAPARLTIFTGARGVGKTVMLTEVGDLATRHGWIVVSETATAGLVDRLTRAVARQLTEFDPNPRTGRALTGITLPGGAGLQLSDPAEPEPEDLRRACGTLLDAIEPHGTGLLITVDEVHRRARTELRALAVTYQHLVREDRNVALVMAGLPVAVSDLLSDDVLTFLRRASPVVLEDVPLVDVEASFAETVLEHGRTITPRAMAQAAAATGGYPFMIQLVGYHVWRKAAGDLIDETAVAQGVPAARKRLGSTVHETSMADLSEVDRTFLVAMAQDLHLSQMADLAQRLGVSLKYASVYRARLIAAGVIEPAGRGQVRFAIPYFGEFLREHATTYQMPQHR